MLAAPTFLPDLKPPMHHVSALNDRSTPVTQTACNSAALQALQAENAALKTRLAEAIRVCADGGQLDVLEEFQGRFIATDMVITLLRRELSTLGAAANKVQADLGADLQLMLEQFHSLKEEFERYIAGIVPAAN